MRARRGLLVAAAMLMPAVACAGGSDEATPATTMTTSTTPITTPTTTPTTTVPTTATSSPTTTSAPTTSAPATSTTTSVPYPTTTVHVVPADCDIAGMLAVADGAIAAARLPTGSRWELVGTTAFDDRTNDPEEFRDRLALDCSVRAVQRADHGDRLLLAAWTGERRAYVVQAADEPETPYTPDQRLQLLIEQPDGEWLSGMEMWAGTMSGGETVIVAVDDYSLGAAAKAWQALPRWEDIPISIETERYAIDALLNAGARNVSPGEDPAPGSTLAAIQFVTPAGLILLATVAPVGDFDPTAALIEGERTLDEISGIDVVVTTGASDSYAVGSVGWTCGDSVWFIDSVWGTVDELVDWVDALVSTGACSP